MRRLDMTDLRFGRLIAIEYAGRIRKGNAFSLAWRCLCDCGKEKIICRPDLMSGRVSSCGCREGATHGMSKASGYHSYLVMVSRCTNPEAKDFARYGYRGIVVCEQWLFGRGSKSGVECFFDDMGQKPGPGFSIERINNSRGYFPDNCKWATPHEQSLNRKNNYFPPGSNPREICKGAGINYSTFRARVARGVSIEEALKQR